MMNFLTMNNESLKIALLLLKVPFVLLFAWTKMEWGEFEER